MNNPTPHSTEMVVGEFSGYQSLPEREVIITCETREWFYAIAFGLIPFLALLAITAFVMRNKEEKQDVSTLRKELSRSLGEREKCDAKIAKKLKKERRRRMMIRRNMKLQGERNTRKLEPPPPPPNKHKKRKKIITIRNPPTPPRRIAATPPPPETESASLESKEPTPTTTEVPQTSTTPKLSRNPSFENAVEPDEQNLSTLPTRYAVTYRNASFEEALYHPLSAPAPPTYHYYEEIAELCANLYEEIHERDSLYEHVS